MDKISIIVPCYNAQKSMKLCIESIKKQSYKNIEVLLIDDGSTDDTKKIIQQEIKGDNRFNYYHKNNSGVSDTRNMGLEKATGKYICFLDSDDWIEPDFVHSLYQKILDEKADVVASDIKRIYPNKTTYNKIYSKIDLLKYTAPWNKMYKKKLFDDYQIRFPSNLWYEDIDVSFKMYMVSKKTSIDHHYFHNYIQNTNSLVHTYDDRIFDIFSIMDDIELFAKEHQLMEKFQLDFEFLNIYHILIGTTYRSSFHSEFKINMLKDIVCQVEKKYPNWFQNSYIKSLSFPFKIYLFLIRKHCYSLLYFLLKHFNKLFSL